LKLVKFARRGCDRKALVREGPAPQPPGAGFFLAGPHPSPRVAVFAEGASPRAGRIVLIAMARLSAVSPACWTTLMVYCPQAPQHAIEPFSPPGRPTRVLRWSDSFRLLSGECGQRPCPGQEASQRLPISSPDRPAGEVRPSSPALAEASVWCDFLRGLSGPP
jgi:hypothetical protein